MIRISHDFFEYTDNSMFKKHGWTIKSRLIVTKSCFSAFPSRVHAFWDSYWAGYRHRKLTVSAFHLSSRHPYDVEARRWHLVPLEPRLCCGKNWAQAMGKTCSSSCCWWSQKHVANNSVNFMPFSWIGNLRIGVRVVTYRNNYSARNL